MPRHRDQDDPLGSRGFREAAYESLVAQTSDAVVIIDLDGEVLRWNSAAERLFGIPAKRTEGRPHPMLRKRQEFLQELRDAAFRPEGTEHRFMIRRRDMTSVLISTKLFPVNDDNGAPVAVVSLSRQVLAEGDVSAACEPCRRLVTEDLRGTLSAVAGYAQLLSRPSTLEDSSKRIRVLAALDSAGKQTAEMLDDLQVVFEGRSGEDFFVMRPLDVARLLSETVERRSLRSRGPEFVVDIARGLPKLVGDQRYLERALMHLIDEIASGHAPGEVHLSAAPRADGVVLRVGSGPDHRNNEKALQENPVADTDDRSLHVQLAHVVAKGHGGWLVERSGAGEHSLLLYLPVKGSDGREAQDMTPKEESA